MSSHNPGRRLWISIDTTDRGRSTTTETGTVQEVLPQLLASAADRAGLRWEEWETRVAGEGLISAVPQSESEARVVDCFMRQLSRLLRRYNGTVEPGARLRLGLVVDRKAGGRAANGWADTAPKSVTRLEGNRVLREALDRTPAADMAVLLSEQVYKDVVEAGSTSLGKDLFACVTAERTTGEEPVPARLWIPLASDPLCAKVPAQAVRTVKAASVVLLAVTGLLVWLVVRGGNPTRPTVSPTTRPSVSPVLQPIARLKIEQRAPYTKGDTLRAELVTPLPMSTPTTHRMRLVVSDHLPGQALCARETRVTTSVPENGGRPARGVLSDGDVLTVPLAAGDTSANVSLAVSTGKGCATDIVFEDVTRMT